MPSDCDDATRVYHFDLKPLLLIPELHMRKIADDSIDLTIGRYFKMLSKFLEMEPVISEALKKFAANDADQKDWKVIESVISLFKDLGIDKNMTDFYAISNARGKGDHRLAAFHAHSVEQSFADFFAKVISAKITKKPENFTDSETPLTTCIRIMDEEEANRKLLILTVDDSPAILEAVAAVLSDEYKIFKLPKPTMLENVLKQVNPELFLLDYQMPELNGFELIPIIRSFEQHKETPIVFLTSEGTIDNITAAISLGACDFIIKPFHPEQLREKVAKHIVRKNNLR